MDEKEKRKKKFGEYLNLLRQTKNVSVKEVAEATGISDPYLYQVEKGQKALTDPEYLKKLAYYFNIEISELLKKAGYIPESGTEQKNDTIIKHLNISMMSHQKEKDKYIDIFKYKIIINKEKNLEIELKTELIYYDLVEQIDNICRHIATTLQKILRTYKENEDEEEIFDLD